MPTFPQHRNMHGTHNKVAAGSHLHNQSVTELPAISDLLGSLLKKRRVD